MSCLGAVGTICPRILLTYYTALAYEVQGSYVPIHLLACYQSWARQRLPYAERVWSDLIELPCEPEVSLTQVERIARITRQVLGNCANSTVKGCRRLNAAVAKAGQK